QPAFRSAAGRPERSGGRGRGSCRRRACRCRRRQRGRAQGRQRSRPLCTRKGLWAICWPSQPPWFWAWPPRPCLYVQLNRDPGVWQSPKEGGPAPASRRGRARLGCGMALRICLVTPFAWSQPHDVNEHVAGVAQELRALGPAVTILSSSNRAKDLAAGRRALLEGALGDGDLIALGPAVPISRRSRVGVPVGVRTNLAN